MGGSILLTGSASGFFSSRHDSAQNRGDRRRARRACRRARLRTLSRPEARRLHWRLVTADGRHTAGNAYSISSLASYGGGATERSGSACAAPRGVLSNGHSDVREASKSASFFLTRTLFETGAHKESSRISSNSQPHSSIKANNTFCGNTCISITLACSISLR